MNWLEALPRHQRRGSRPRCLRLVEGDRSAVAGRLTAMVGLANVVVGENDLWMPWGVPRPNGDGSWDLSPTWEAKIERDEGFLLPDHGARITRWWLEVAVSANTPNWDIASTCRIDGKQGLLLVEAKAHDGELSASGKRMPTTPDGIKNDEKIGAAIKQASAELNRIKPGWSLSRDSHYQLCNRFAWSWKLASFEVPVILVYLGFLHAHEMDDRGEPFASHEGWVRAIAGHACGLVPGSVWDNRLTVGDTPLWVLIRSTEVKLR